MCSVYTAVNAPYRSTIKLPVSISMAVLQLQMNHLSQPLPSTFFPLLFQTRIFGDKVVQVFNFLCTGFPSYYLTDSVKALNGTQSTVPNQWYSFILCSSTTGLLTKMAMLPLCRLLAIICNNFLPMTKPTGLTAWHCS